jgi:hypothetical protein
MTDAAKLDELTLLTIDGTDFPLARLKGRENVVVLMRHLA